MLIVNKHIYIYLQPSQAWEGTTESPRSGGATLGVHARPSSIRQRLIGHL